MDKAGSCLYWVKPSDGSEGLYRSTQKEVDAALSTASRPPPLVVKTSPSSHLAVMGKLWARTREMHGDKKIAEMIRDATAADDGAGAARTKSTKHTTKSEAVLE